MSQFPGGYQDPYGQAVMPPKKTSGLAIGALVCSLLGVVPCVGWVTAPLGVLLGAIAVGTTGPTAERKGRGLGIAALIIGLILCVVWAWFGLKAYGMVKGYSEFVMNGPQQTLKKGFDGDVAGFQADFTGTAATMPASEAQAFLDQLKARYGAFQSCGFDTQSGSPPQGQPGQPQVPFPYVLQFANQSVNAEIELVFADQNATSFAGAFMKKIGYIVIQDPVAGNLAYPSTATLSSGAANRGAATRPRTGNPRGSTTIDAADDADAETDTGTDAPLSDGG